MQNGNEIEVPRRGRRARGSGAPGWARRLGRRQRAGVALAMLAGVAMLAAGCGGGSGSSSASVSGSQNNPAQFAQCMRGHGVPSFPDPNSNGKFGLQVTKGGPLDPSSATFQSAVQACRKYDTSFGSPGAGSGSRAGALKFSKCMRSHGVTNFPDPQPNGALVMKNGDLRNNPDFQPAMQACRHLLSGGGSGATMAGGGS